MKITLMKSLITNALFLAGFCLQPFPTQAESGKKPNILFILCDDLGWSDSTLFGSTKLYETPNIERLARRGILFNQAYGHPMCTPTRSSIMSGLWPARTGMTEAAGHLEELRLAALPKTEGEPWQKVAAPWGATRLDTCYRTIAEELKQAGYATGHFAKWHLGREPYDPLHRGFDVDIPHTYEPAQPGGYYAPWKWPTGVNYDSGKPGEYVDDRMADEAIKFMSANREKPFFCNFWMFSPHGGPRTTPELEAKYEKKILSLGPDYPQRNPETAGLIQELDRVVGRLLKAVDEMGLASNTIIIFNSDNGGWSWPSGNRKDVDMTSNSPLRSGKSSLYEGGTRVPLAFIWPGKVKPDSHSDAIFSSVDFYPTILSMLGLHPARQKLDGFNQVPALLGKPGPRDTTFCFFPHYDRDQMGPGASVRKGDWKLIMRFCDNNDQSDRYELYNLREDIGETKNLASKNPDHVGELNLLLRQYLKDTGAVLPVRNPKYDPKVKMPAGGNPKQGKPKKLGHLKAPQKTEPNIRQGADAYPRLKMEAESDAGV